MPELVDRYVGTDVIAAGTTMRAPEQHLDFWRKDFLGPQAQLAASYKTDFFALEGNFRVTFLPAPDGGPSQRAIVHRPSEDNFVARRDRKLLPETKDRSLEEIEEVLRSNYSQS